MTTRKYRTKPCTCGGYMERTWDADDKPAWACTNCRNVEARKIHTRRAGMTPSQREALEILKATAAAAGKFEIQEHSEHETCLLIFAHGVKWYDGSVNIRVGRSGAIEATRHYPGGGDQTFRGLHMAKCLLGYAPDYSSVL